MVDKTNNIMENSVLVKCAQFRRVFQTNYSYYAMKELKDFVRMFDIHPFGIRHLKIVCIIYVFDKKKMDIIFAKINNFAKRN